MPDSISARTHSTLNAFPRILLLWAAAAWIPGCSQPTGPARQTQQASQPAATDHAHEDHAHEDHAHEDHGHEDHGHEHKETTGFTPPKTVAEAIAQLKQLSADIEKALAEKKTELADDLVHSAGHLIEDLHEKIAAAGLQEKAAAAATAAAEAIFDVYDKLDTALHGAEEELKKIDFSTYAPSLEKATSTLEDLFKKAEAAVTGTPPESAPTEAPTQTEPQDTNDLDPAA